MDVPRKKCIIKGCLAKTGVTFYQFPSRTRQPELRKYWLEAVRLANQAAPRWLPKKHHRICSNHFEDVEPVPEDHNYMQGQYDVPTIFPKLQQGLNEELTYQEDDLGEEAVTFSCVEAESENVFDAERVPQNEACYLDEFMVPAEGEYIIDDATSAMILLKEQPVTKEEKSAKQEKKKKGSKKKCTRLNQRKTPSSNIKKVAEKPKKKAKKSIRKQKPPVKIEAENSTPGKRDLIRIRTKTQAKVKRISAKTKKLKAPKKTSGTKKGRTTRRKKDSEKRERTKTEKEIDKTRKKRQVKVKQEKGKRKSTMPPIVIRCDSSSSSSSPVYDVTDEDDPDVDPVDVKEDSSSDSEEEFKSCSQKMPPRLRPRVSYWDLPSKRMKKPKEEDEMPSSVPLGLFLDEMPTKRWKGNKADKSTQVALPGKCDGFVFCVTRDDDFNVATQGNIFYNFKLPMPLLKMKKEPVIVIKKDKTHVFAAPDTN